MNKQRMYRIFWTWVGCMIGGAYGASERGWHGLLALLIISVPIAIVIEVVMNWIWNVDRSYQ